MGVTTRRYGIRGPIILNERPKQAPLRGHASTHPTAPGVIGVSYPSYDTFGSTQPKIMEFIPTPKFPKKWWFMETYLKYAFGNVIFRLIWIMPHCWVSFCLCNIEDVWLMTC